MQLKNINPMGEVEVLGVIVPAGDIFTPTREQAVQIILQRPNWEAVDEEAIALLAELEAPASPDVAEPEPEPEPVPSAAKTRKGADQ